MGLSHGENGREGYVASCDYKVTRANPIGVTLLFGIAQKTGTPVAITERGRATS